MRSASHCRFNVASAGLLLLATNAFGQIEHHCEIAAYFDARRRLVRIVPKPVLVVEGTRISDGFRIRFHPILHRLLLHEGVDIAAPRGAQVHCIAAGVVLEARRKGTFGLYVRVRHEGDLETGYAHLSALGPGIRAGAAVVPGQVIGLVGSSGLSTAAHLHLTMARHDLPVRPVCFCAPPRERAAQSTDRRPFSRQDAAPNHTTKPHERTTMIRSKSRVCSILVLTAAALLPIAALLAQTTSTSDSSKTAELQSRLNSLALQKKIDAASSQLEDLHKQEKATPTPRTTDEAIALTQLQMKEDDLQTQIAALKKQQDEILRPSPKKADCIPAPRKHGMFDRLQKMADRQLAKAGEKIDKKTGGDGTQSPLPTTDDLKNMGGNSACPAGMVPRQ